MGCDSASQQDHFRHQMKTLHLELLFVIYMDYSAACTVKIRISFIFFFLKKEKNMVTQKYIIACPYCDWQKHYILRGNRNKPLSEFPKFPNELFFIKHNTCPLQYEPVFYLPVFKSEQIVFCCSVSCFHFCEVDLLLRIFLSFFDCSYESRTDGGRLNSTPCLKEETTCHLPF